MNAQGQANATDQQLTEVFYCFSCNGPVVKCYGDDCMDCAEIDFKAEADQQKRWDNSDDALSDLED